MRLILLSLVAVLAVTLIACDDGPVGGGVGKPALIAGYEYINWAWGFHQEYGLIDERGSVWQLFPSVDDSLWVLDTLSAYTEDDFAKLLSGADSLAIRLPGHEVRAIQRLAGPVSADSITDCEWTASDAGILQTFLFVRNSRQVTFRRALLYQLGDQSCHNVHPSAALLDSIIMKYHLREDNDPEP